MGDLPWASAQIAKGIVSGVAKTLREADVAAHVWPHKIINGLNYISDTLLEVASDMGADLPDEPSLRDNVRNWGYSDAEGDSSLTLPKRRVLPYQVSFPGITTAKTEMSTGWINVGLTVSTASEPPYSGLAIPPRDTDLDPMILRLTLFFPNLTQPNATTTLTFNGQQISVVGPIMSINDPSNELVLVNNTHALGASFTDPPVLITEILAAAQAPDVPDLDDTALLYRNATISLAFDPSYLADELSISQAHTAITIYDLVNGKPLKDVTSDGETEGYLLFSCTLSIGNGIWGGALRGGGSFALGLVDPPNTTASNMSPRTSATSISLSQTPNSSISSKSFSRSTLASTALLSSLRTNTSLNIPQGLISGSPIASAMGTSSTRLFTYTFSNTTVTPPGTSTPGTRSGVSGAHKPSNSTININPSAAVSTSHRIAASSSYYGSKSSKGAATVSAQSDISRKSGSDHGLNSDSKHKSQSSSIFNSPTKKSSSVHHSIVSTSTLR